MEFDYFYGPEDAEQYQFYRIPKLLITSEQFKDVSVESKLLYGLMLDRLSLSIKNGWFDSLNRAYIIYTIEDVMEDMHCRSQKACKLVSELEKNAGLIKKKRQGLGKPSLIYVLKFSTVCPQKDSESHFKKCENHTSGDVKITHQEVRKSHGSNTDNNDNDNRYTENPIYPGSDEEEMRARMICKSFFEDQIEYDYLLDQYPYERETIRGILDLLVDTYCSKRKYIRVAGDDKPADVVKSQIAKLNSSHIQYVMDCLKENTTDVRNIKQYLLAALYNAPTTISSYYQAKVNYDFYGNHN